MVRDSTKLLCRIIEEFEKTGKRARGETSFEPVTQGLAFPLVLPGLTDRKEWPDATLKAFYYGAELNKDFVRKTFAQEIPQTNSPYQSDGPYYPDSTDHLSFPQRTEHVGLGLPHRNAPLSSQKGDSDPLSAPHVSDSAAITSGIEGSNDTVTAVDGISTEMTEEVVEVPPPPLTMMYTVNGDGSPVEEFIKTLQKDGKEIPTRIMLTGEI
jgi:hypothetical protein